MTRNVAYYQKNRPLKIFLSYYGPHKHLFFLDMFCALVICLIDLAFPYLSRSALTYCPSRSTAFSSFSLVFSPLPMWERDYCTLLSPIGGTSLASG